MGSATRAALRAAGLPETQPKPSETFACLVVRAPRPVSVRLISRDIADAIAHDLAHTSGSYRDIAADYNVGISLVCEIAKGRHWSQREQEPIARVELEGAAD